MATTHEATRSSGRRSRAATSLAAAVAAVAVPIALIACWAGAMKSPALHEQQVGLVVSAGTDGSAIAGQASDAVVWRSLADPGAARRAVDHGDLAAALVVAPAGGTLFVASGGGPITAQALTATIGAQARAARLPMRVVDLRPPQSGDPRTLGLFVLILGWVVGGIAGGILLLRAAGPASRSVRGSLGLLGWQAGYAVGAAVLSVVLVDSLLGMMTGHAVALAATGALVMVTVAVFVTAMLSLFGPAGLVLAIGCLVIVGNPASGAMVPAGMLPSGWRFLSEVLPNTAGARLVRSVTYFGGHGINDPLVVLGCYLGVSILVLLALAWRRGAAGTPAAGTTPRPAAASTPEFASAAR